MVKQENVVNVTSDESDVDQTEGRNKRKICDKCSHTYFYSCLICEQNENYEASLAADREREKILLNYLVPVTFLVSQLMIMITVKRILTLHN